MLTTVQSTVVDEDALSRPGPPVPAVAAAAAEEVPAEALAVVPGCFLQFIDLAIPTGSPALATRRRFYEEPDAGGDGGAMLHVIGLEDGLLYHPETHDPLDAGQTYQITAMTAVEMLAGAWLPVPLRRMAGNGRSSEDGPTNWARLYVAPPASDLVAEAPIRAVLALDTTIDPRSRPGTRSYPTPAREDCGGAVRFRLAESEVDVGAFVSEPWVDDWLAEVLRERQAARFADDVAVDRDRTLEHIAHYLVLLAALASARILPDITLQALATDGGDLSRPVRLAIDLGHGRHAAALLESSAGPAARQIIESLPVRDLSHPTTVHSGPLSARMTFAKPELGREAHARWSGRANAFHWPSLVRVGPEAERLAAEEHVDREEVGLSSVLHYAWDERPASAVWRFATDAGSAGRRAPVVAGPQLSLLTEAGEAIGVRGRSAPATAARFARSSLTMLAGVELLLHAIVAINSPLRSHRLGLAEGRRRIDEIVLTLPAGLPEQLCELIHGRTRAAVDLVWRALGWAGPGGAGELRRPRVVIARDSAIAAQAAYLHSEMQCKFAGRCSEYLDLIGKSRPEVPAARSLRVATIDIGASAVGFAIATYAMAGDELRGRHEFSDRLTSPGGELAETIVERIVLPAIERRLAHCRIGDPRRFLRRLLAGGRGSGWPGAGPGLGSRFAAELALAAAVGLIEAHIAARAAVETTGLDCRLGALIEEKDLAARRVALRIDSLAAEEGANGFAVLDAEVVVPSVELAAAVRDALRPALVSIRHAVNALDCDLVLVTGWGARLPEVRDLVIEALPTRPNRLIVVSDYRADPRHIPVDASGRVGDPRPLSAIGALLLRVPLADGGLAVAWEGEPAAGRRIYVGVMDERGIVSADNVLFERPASGAASAAEEEAIATVALTLPAMIGQRRVGLEQWPAQPLFLVAAAGRSQTVGSSAPLKVSLRLGRGAEPGALDLQVVRVRALDGTQIAPTDVTVRFQTIPFGESRWLDTSYGPAD